MTSSTKKAVLAGGAALLLIVAAIGYRSFARPEPATRPVLVWDASSGATHYEVQIDGKLYGTYAETAVELPAGFRPRGHVIQVRACNGPNCSPWQPLTAR
jgi:hypothetical protein